MESVPFLIPVIATIRSLFGLRASLAHHDDSGYTGDVFHSLNLQRRSSPRYEKRPRSVVAVGSRFKEVFMKISIMLIIAFLLAGCASKPMVLPYQQGTYMVSNETEFDVTGMVNEVHMAAQAKCESEGKDIEILKTETGNAGTGAFGPKRGYGLIFRCI